MRRWIAFMASAVALTCLALVLISWSAPSMADQKKDDGNKVQQSQTNKRDDQHDGWNTIWSVPKVNVTIKPGQSTTTSITLTAHDDLGPMTVRVTPALVPYLTVSPTSIPRLLKGQTQIFTLMFSAKIDAFPTTTQGVLELREIIDEGHIGWLVSRPVPVTASVVWPLFVDSTSGLQLLYPNFGRDSEVRSHAVVFPDGQTEDDYTIYIATAAGEMRPLLTIVVNSNRGSSTMSSWFLNNVDPGGTLISSGAYQLVALSNGMQAVVDAGNPLPDSYSGGEVDGIYAMSSSSRYVVTGNLEDVWTLQPDLGGTAGLGMATIRNIIENMRLP